MANQLNLTLDSTAITADQTDFPLTIKLDGTDPLHAAVFAELGANYNRFHITANDVELSIEVEQWNPSEVFRYPAAFDTTNVKATTYYSASYYPHLAMNPALPKTGTYLNCSWVCTAGTIANQKFAVDLGTAKVVRKIYLENNHLSGGQTDTGIKNFTVFGTNEPTAFDVTTYADETNLVNLGTFQAAQHVAADTVDPQYFDIDNNTAYRYIVLKIADIWGATTYMALRHIAFMEVGGNLPILIPQDEGTVVEEANSAYPGKAFDGVAISAFAITDSWYASAGGASYKNTGYCGKDYGAGNEKVVTKASLWVMNASNDASPRNFTIQGSNDNTNWTDLVTVVDYDYTVASPAWAEYEFENTVAYRYVRLNVTQNWGDVTYLVIGEIQFYAIGGEAVLHTKVPTYSASVNTELLLDYNSTNLINTLLGVAGSTAAQAVWSTSIFAARWGKNQDPTAGGACVLDSTANANHLTPYNVTLNADGSYEFNGTTAYMSTPDSDILDLSAVAGYALEVFFNPDVAQRGGLICKMQTATPYTGYALVYNQTANKVASFVNPSGNWDISVGTVAIDTEHHAVATKTKLYLEGVFDKNRTYSGLPGVTVDALWIGRDYLNAYLHGSLSEARIYVVEPSADWIKLTNLSLTDQLITWSIVGVLPPLKLTLDSSVLTPGDVKIAGDFNLTLQGNGNTGRNMRCKVTSAVITGTGTKVKIRLDYAGAWSFAQMWFGKKGIGDWDFDGNQVQVLFSGSAGVSMTGELDSDEFVFEIEAGADYILAADITSLGIPYATVTGVSSAYCLTSSYPASATTVTGMSATSASMLKSVSVVVDGSQTDFPLTIKLDSTNPLHAAVFAELPPWTPADITTRLWLDASDESTVTEVGGYVTQVADKSGNVDHVTSAGTIVNTPSGINGLPVLDFGSADNKLALPFTFDMRDMLCCYVLQVNNFHESTMLLSHSSVNIQQTITYTTGALSMTGSPAIYTGTVNNGPVVLGEPCLAIFDGDATGGDIYFNGVKGTTGAAQAVAANFNQIGLRGGADNDFYGYLAEIIFVPITEDREKIEGYLAHKWGLAASLPVTHPYKTDAPMVEDYSKIHITAGGVELPIEVELWDSLMGKAVLHTKVPTYSASADTELLLDYNLTNNDNTLLGIAGSVAAQAVWDSNFVAVYHFAQDPSVGDILDSTSNGLDLTPAGTVANLSLDDGLFGKAILFGGAAYLSAAPADLSAMQSNYTLEMLHNVDAIASYMRMMVVGGNTGAPVMTSYATQAKYSLGVWGDDVVSAIPLETNSWHHAASINTAGTIRLMVDGVLDSPSNTVAVQDLSNDAIHLGSEPLNHPNYVYTGHMAEVRISKVARSGNWIKLTNLSLTDQVITWSVDTPPVPVSTNPISQLVQIYWLTTPITNCLRQIYSFNLESQLIQYYSLAFSMNSQLKQVYGLFVGSALVQRYSNATVNISKLVQMYNDAGLPKSQLIQMWGQALIAVSSLEQPYHLTAEAISKLVQIYSVVGNSAISQLSQLYDILDHNIAKSQLRQFWHLINSDALNITPDIFVSVNGRPIKFNQCTVSASRSDFRISADIVTTSDLEAAKFVFNAPVIINFNGTVFHLIVRSKYKATLTNGNISWRIKVASKSSLLTSPASKTVDAEYGPGMASEIAKSLAADKGVTITWTALDWYVSANKLYATYEAPLAVIRKLAHVAGARLRPTLEGNLIVAPNYHVPVSAWGTTSPEYVFTTSHFYNISESPVEKEGYNMVVVSDQSTSSDKAFIDTVDISSTTKTVRGFVVPWKSSGISLLHSGGTWVTKKYNGIVTEILEEEDVEFVNGSASVSKPIYRLVDIVWTEVSLGNITISEDGSLSVSYVDGPTLGCSKATIKYETKYHSWTATDDKIESVQFILNVED